MTDDLAAHGGWSTILGALSKGEDLTADQAEAALDTILLGVATDAQIAGFIVALRQKGETVEELTGLVRAMHNAAAPLDMPSGTVDIVGMGGSPSRRRAALNISTMACFVAAGAGAIVCKHGNRRASSTSGSFDLLEALGVDFELTPGELELVVAEHGVGFAFARTYHPAMRHVGPVRAQLGIPTVFNALGPLSHPARLTRQVVGTADSSLAVRMIEVLRATGSEFAWVVTGDGPLDELATSGPTTIRQLDHGEITSFTIDASDLGIERPEPGDLDGGDAAANKIIVEQLFGGARGPVRDIVSLNAAAAIVVAGIAGDIESALTLAGQSIDSGAAQAKLDGLRAS